MEEAEKILRLLKDEIVVVKESQRAHMVEQIQDEDGKERKVSRKFADLLAGRRSTFEVWRADYSPEGTTYRFKAARDLVQIYEYGHTWGYFEKGEGYIFKLGEAEQTAKKLSQDVASLTKERDAWKKRYDDCESSKFGTGAFTSNVEE